MLKKDRAERAAAKKARLQERVAELQARTAQSLDITIFFNNLRSFSFSYLLNYYLFGSLRSDATKFNIFYLLSYK